MTFSVLSSCSQPCPANPEGAIKCTWRCRGLAYIGYQVRIRKRWTESDWERLSSR